MIRTYRDAYFQFVNVEGISFILFSMSQDFEFAFIRIYPSMYYSVIKAYEEFKKEHIKAIGENLK